MADRTIFDSPAERGPSPEPSSSTPLGRVRWVTLRRGWHLVFLTTGILSVLWIKWRFRYYRKPTNHATLTATELRYIYQETAPNYARLTAMLFCAGLVVPICTASGVKSVWTAIALISVAAGAHQGWSANLFTTSSDMFPRSAVGSVVGIGGMAGSAGSTHSDASLRGIAASAYLGALAILCLLAPRLKKVEPTT
jgi:hypothetical protein